MFFQKDISNPLGVTGVVRKQRIPVKNYISTFSR